MSDQGQHKNNETFRSLQLHSGEYVDRFEKGQSTYRLERLLPYINLTPTSIVADFACGNAMLLPLLFDKVASYHGVDFSPEFIAKCKTKMLALGIQNAEFACKDINEFCQEYCETFDASFAMDFLEHVCDDELLRILKSIHSSLKPGGRFYAHTPNARFFLEIAKHHNFLVRQFPEHIAVRDIGETTRLFECAGFEIERIEFLSHYNALRVLHPLSFLPLVGKFFQARLFVVARKSM